MLSRQKLHTFIFRDKYQLSAQEVLAEAHESALRHGDLMGWSDVEVVDSHAKPTRQGEYVCYSFEIWGIGESSQSGDVESSPADQKNLVRPSKVAKDAEI